MYPNKADTHTTMKTRSVIAISILLSLAPRLRAQPWIDGLPSNGGANFYDIQRSFNQYWEGKDHKEKGKGWKPFKRWEWFWEPRVYPRGEFPNPMQLYNEYEKVATVRGKTSTVNGGNWTELGPSSSSGGYHGVGRINCVRPDPTNPTILWAGSPAGGLWKSTNSGTTWSTLTDELPTLGVTDIAIDPTNTSIMYIGTGDGDAGDTYGVGVLKSTNGGITWNTTGLNWTTSQGRTISRLVMHPSNPSILLAAGSGIYMTTNGGTTWTQTQSSTHKDLEFKPGNPSIVYASTSTGGIRRSTDGGNTWTTLSSGLPTSGVGRVALGVSPANAEYVYALFANNSNSGFYGLYRSTDSGVSWSLMSSTPNLLGWNSDGSDAGGQGWYDLAIAVSQTDANTIYTGGVNNWKST
ncbi:MAG TPA: glycosyl hydrolase, partial [Bacteroidetes bacterium]|nr:glycosyl hydrolase [Bacteroidota bacterium]